MIKFWWQLTIDRNTYLSLPVIVWAKLDGRQAPDRYTLQQNVGVYQDDKCCVFGKVI